MASKLIARIVTATVAAGVIALGAGTLHQATADTGTQISTVQAADGDGDGGDDSNPWD